MAEWTIQKLLKWVNEYLTGKGIDSPRLSAELLLSHVLGLKRIELYTHFDKLVSKQQLDKLHDLVKRAGRHEPIVYLTGKTEFYSLELDITPDCMIPRPETELLVERAIEFLRSRTGKQPAVSLPALSEPVLPVLSAVEGSVAERVEGSNPSVCDLCTGSGCIAVAIAKNFQNAHIFATDISAAALDIAAKNVEKYHLQDRITLLCGDLFDPLIPQLDVEKLDLIVCNPPYVSAAEFEKLSKNVKDYEPRVAFYAGDDGLDIYRRIIEKVGDFLKSSAVLMLEIGFSQGPAVKDLLERANCFAEIAIEKDTGSNDRIVIARKLSLRS